MSKWDKKESQERIAIFLSLPIPPDGASHQEIAEVLGVSKQRVSQIEQQALKKLALNANVLRAFRQLLGNDD